MLKVGDYYQGWKVIHLPAFLDDDGDLIAVVEKGDESKSVKRDNKPDKPSGGVKHLLDSIVKAKEQVQAIQELRKFKVTIGSYSYEFRSLEAATIYLKEQKLTWATGPDCEWRNGNWVHNSCTHIVQLRRTITDLGLEISTAEGGMIECHRCSAE